MVDKLWAYGGASLLILFILADLATAAIIPFRGDSIVLNILGFRYLSNRTQVLIATHASFIGFITVVELIFRTDDSSVINLLINEIKTVLSSE